MSYNNQGRQTELVKSALVNYIKDNRLVEGDHIPTQAKLRQMLGVGNAVIGRAIKTLADDGILQSRGRNGVIVINTSTEGYQGRNIGIICHHDTEYVSAACTMQALAITLTRRACQLNLFIKTEPGLKDCFSLNEFRGVERAIHKHQIDGLFSTLLLDDKSVNFCEKHHIPFCYVGLGKTVPNVPGVRFLINLPELLVKLSACNYRRPMLIHMGHPYTAQVRSDFLSCAHLFDFGNYSSASFCRLIRENASSSWKLEDNMKNVINLVHQLLDMQQEERPDILIIPDDVIATWIAFELKSSDWHPELIHAEHQQLAFSWSLRNLGGYYLIDSLKLAELSANLMLDLICKKSQIQYNIDYIPAFIEKSLDE